MTHINYFKQQAKNLFKDYKTQTKYFDDVIQDYLYTYNPKYFNIDAIILSYAYFDEENFTLMKAQHIIADMVGFKKWDALIKASEIELEIAKLLFDNQDKINIKDWEMYISGLEVDGSDPENRLAILKHVFIDVDGHKSQFLDFRLKKTM